MTTEVTDRQIPLPAAYERPASGAARILGAVPLLIGGALLGVILYAVFDHGAVGRAPGARVEVALAVIAAAATAAWLGFDALRLRASPIACAGLGLLAGFVGWSALSLLWSVAPDQTWFEVNRVLSYLLILTLGIALGATQLRAPALLCSAFLCLAGLVAVYALGQKLAPGLHVTGVFDLNQTGAIPRLQEPIGYWNALALFLALAAPAGLQHAADPVRSPMSRLIAAGGLQLLLLAIGLTLSRGGLLALAVALVVGIAAADRRLPALAWLALVLLATLPPLGLGLMLHSLSAADVPLSSREGGGAILAGVLVLSLAGLYAGGRGLLRFEDALLLPQRERWARTVSRGGLAGLVALGLLIATLTHAWHHFTSPAVQSNVSPSRLLTTDSYRWLWWKEAAHAFSARPLGGWGAGSFGVVHLIYRQNTLPVQQPHSGPLQLLSETGVIGALLGLAGLALLVAAAVRSARRAGLTGPERGAAMALLAGVVAYFMHFLYDWDWTIPAVTLPALLFLGVLIGADRARPPTQRAPLAQPLSLGTRALAIAAATLWLCLLAISSVLPSLAGSDGRAALIEAASSSPGALAHAQAEGRRASSLDPLSDAGPRAEASIALHRGELTRARYELERALGREPSDSLSWSELIGVDSVLGDRAGARQAARRVIALDPRGPAARALRSSNLTAYGR